MDWDIEDDLLLPPSKGNRRNENFKSFNVTIYSMSLGFKTRNVKKQDAIES